MTNYLLTGGGTAGHVNPLLSLADYISEAEPDAKIFALGTREGLETDLVPARGYELLTIAKLPFPRKISLSAFVFPGAFFEAVGHVRKIIRNNKIDIVVGFGGYASAPAYIAARLERTKLVIHEANALPGMANRIGAKFANAVAVAFNDTPLPAASHQGMPLRKEIETAVKKHDAASARKYFGLDEEMFTLLVTGGSLGARSINQTVEESRDLLAAAGVQVLHIVGGKSELEPIDQKSYLRIKYCDRMDLALSAADFAVSRAGAATVSELTALGVPALYIPYGVGNGEQRHNIKTVLEAEGAIACTDSEFTREFVAQTLVPLLSSAKRLKQMSAATKKLAITDGTANLYRLVQGVLTN
jgi:UDP-N-acetylglucosamine--N-acetylmuramyl-(pentapeptide) pyrophosphoryl-undecaprenol N-acetylglucosamine transferase